VAGQRTVLSDWTGRYTSSFDSAGRVSRVINPAGIRLCYAYDSAGQRSHLDQPTGRFTYQFDKGGRISRLINAESQITSWAYDTGGRVTVQRLANGVRVSNIYDKADQITRLANIASGGTTLSSFSYLYNAVGNRTRVIESNGDRVTWSYDKTYQLTVERRSGANAYAITYGYDGVGNRARTVSSGSPTTYLYDAANQLTRSQAAAGITTNTFDGAGNLARSAAPSNQRTTNSWDGENRLMRAALPSGTVNTFAYSGDGQRVQKQDSSGTTKHVWDAQNILLETDGGNSVQLVYSLEPVVYGNLISQRHGGVTSFYLFDALGSTSQLAGTTGTVTDSYLYRSFGDAISAAGTTLNPFRYIGQLGYYFDTDLLHQYARARYYAPALGRFLSRDQFGPYGLGSYVYATNDPVRYADPSGMNPLLTALVGCAANTAFSVIESWWSGDSRCQCVCKGISSCVIGAVAGALGGLFPSAAVCLVGVTSTVGANIASRACDSYCGGSTHPILCDVMSALVSGGLSCFVNARPEFNKNLQLMNIFVANQLSRLVNHDLVGICGLR
jgi:RHS repeat-associated protein